MPIFNYLAVFRRIHKKRVHLAVIILMPISRGWAQNPYLECLTNRDWQRKCITASLCGRDKKLIGLSLYEDALATALEVSFGKIAKAYGSHDWQLSVAQLNSYLPRPDDVFTLSRGDIEIYRMSVRYAFHKKRGGLDR